MANHVSAKKRSRQNKTRNTVNSQYLSKFRNAPENLSIMVYRVTPEEGITPETVERIA